jgi:8-hydroxy-5-deazaflavin:NADPH oxidoreductase
MKLGIIGSGNIGRSIGKWASRLGYEVIFSAKNPEHAEEAVKAAGGNSKAGSVRDAVKSADMVLLAVPYRAVEGILSDLGSLVDGKVLIDATNALSPDYSSLAFGFTTSAAEEIQKLAPKATVVKAFNTVFAQIFSSQNPELKGRKLTVFYASDDKQAKTKVAGLITKMGFDAVDAGPLKAARNLEPLALLNINLGYGLGHGTSIGFTLLR